MDKRNISVTLECFVKKDNKYLMLHRAPHKRIMPGVWMAPGGHREFNEGLFECARREIMEETGLADYASGKVVQNPHDGELVWLTPKEISKLDNLLPEIHKVLPKLFDGKDKVLSYRAVYEKGSKMTFFEMEKG